MWKALKGGRAAAAALALAAAVAAVSPATAVEKVDGKFWMVIGGRQAVSHVDPGQSYDYAIRMMTQALYDGLNARSTNSLPCFRRWWGLGGPGTCFLKRMKG